MELKEYMKNTMPKKLKEEEDCPRMLLTFVYFVLSNPIQKLMDLLDSEFDSKRGRPAYPRAMLLIIFFYCFSIDMSNYTKMEDECKKNRFLLIVTNGSKPTRGTFTNFLDKSDATVMKKVFVTTLVLLNDLDFIDFVKLYVDGTDALVRASRHNKITKYEVKALMQVEKWGLLHKNTAASINRTIKGLEEKLEIYKNDEEMCKMIKLVLKRINLYNIDTFAKLDIYKDIIEERNAKSVSLTFPQACWMKLKAGAFDFAFNLQEIMTQNHIILTGILLPQPNDQKTIKYVLKDIFETYKLFIEMQREFGEKDNIPEIKYRFQNFLLIADSGYFTTENLYYLFINKINALIMPKRLAEQHNNELRQEEGLEQKRKDSKRKGFKRVKNGYLCPFGRLMKCIGSQLVKHRKPHPDDELPDNCKTRKYVFKSDSCKGCPNIDRCKNKLIDQNSKLMYEMTEKFLDEEYKDQYSGRFSRSEGINGFLKRDDRTLKFIGTTQNAINNELQIRNSIYNLTRLINLKDTAY